MNSKPLWIHYSTSRHLAASLVLIAAAVWNAATFAVKPGEWTHRTEADFESAVLDGTVITNHGEVQLARRINQIAALEGEDAIIHDIAQPAEADVFVAIGPMGRLGRLKGESIEVEVEFENAQVFAIDPDGKDLWVAVSGEPSRLERRSGKDLSVIDSITLENVTYVWDIAHDKQRIWLATGTEGQVLVIPRSQIAQAATARANANKREQLSKTLKTQSNQLKQLESQVRKQQNKVKSTQNQINQQKAKPAADKDADKKDADKKDADKTDADKKNADKKSESEAESDKAAKDQPSNEVDAKLTKALADHKKRLKDLQRQASDAKKRVDDLKKQVDAIPADEKTTVSPTPVVTTGQDNVLCLAIDKQGTVYAGTDGEGLVYRITSTGKNGNTDFNSFIVYDAKEPEIGALFVDANGIVYAGTADSKQARPGRLTKPTKDEQGRPEKDSDEPDSATENTSDETADASVDSDSPGTGQSDTSDTSAAANDNPNAPDTAVEVATADQSAKPAKPTPQQYDELRTVIRERLQEVKETGAFAANMNSRPTPKPKTVSARSGSTGGSSSSSGSGSGSRSGNAVYRIDKLGFVREIFRESVMILRIIEANGKLIIATGNDGQVYRVDPSNDEVTELADLESEQVTALFSKDGNVLVGTASTGGVSSLDESFAKDGTYTSAVLDADQISLWGQFVAVGHTPKGTKLTLETRSGNVNDPDLGGWSDWSAPRNIPATAKGYPVYLKVDSPPARFFQYRVVMNSSGTTTPLLDEVSLKYLVPNLKPVIQEVKTKWATTTRSSGSTDKRVTPPPAEQTTLSIDWKAIDPNSDKLVYRLEVGDPASNAPFVPLAKDITDTKYSWNTKTVPDGRYVIRVIASDSPDNVHDQAKSTSRISDPITVDNTPPAITNLKLVHNKNKLQVTLDAEDELSPIAEIRYTINGDPTWQFVLPKDRIFDSTNESASINISALSPEAHVVSVRVSDVSGNTSYVSKLVQR